jgi:hypothetical protein
MTNFKRISYFALGLIIGGSIAIASDALAAAPSKPAPKVDCTKKVNANKIECKEAPKSDVKPEVKKPPKVDRPAPPAVKKKATEENAKK